METLDLKHSKSTLLNIVYLCCTSCGS